MTTEIAQLIETNTKLTEEVVLQKDRLKGAADIAEKKASEASTFAAQATEAAALAKQISGLETVDDALGARAPEFIRNAVSTASGGRMCQIQDANGNYNTMVSIPCFTFDDIGMSDLMGTGVHPAFLRTDLSLIPEIWVGAYPATNKGGQATVVENADPYNMVNFDEAKAACAAMGAGWHMMTALEWSAVALWCLANGYQPKGNTQFGRSHAERHLNGRRRDGKVPNDRSGDARTNCGSGPNKWRHDNSPYGIADLVGNVWEWLDGFKLSEGQIVAAEKNMDAEVYWVAQPAYMDSGNKLSSGKTSSTSTNVTWGATGKDVSYVSNTLLKQLLIEPIPETAMLEGRLYYDNDGERLPVRGGTWGGSSDAGLAALALSRERSHHASNIGFRPAFIAH